MVGINGGVMAVSRSSAVVSFTSLIPNGDFESGALTAGSRYAIGLIVVGTTMPAIVASNSLSSIAVSSLPPRSVGAATSQTDLPASRTTYGQVSSTPYARLS
jgi:hypothetical protein